MVDRADRGRGRLRRDRRWRWGRGRAGHHDPIDVNVDVRGRAPRRQLVKPHFGGPRRQAGYVAGLDRELSSWRRRRALRRPLDRFLVPLHDATVDQSRNHVAVKQSGQIGRRRRRSAPGRSTPWTPTPRNGTRRPRSLRSASRYLGLWLGRRLPVPRFLSRELRGRCGWLRWRRRRFLRGTGWFHALRLGSRLIGAKLAGGLGRNLRLRWLPSKVLASLLALSPRRVRDLFVGSSPISGARPFLREIVGSVFGRLHLESK